MKMLAGAIIMALITMGEHVTDKAVFIDVNTGQLMTAEQVADAVSDYDVIFFGEHHDAKVSHDAELALLKALYEKYHKVALGMEMFERDVQPLLDAYLKGSISEAEFLKDSRPWPNYETDYRPMVEFAREHGLPVIGTNVPRYIASGVAKNDTAFLSTLSDTEKQWIASKIYYDSPDYHERFAEAMREFRHMSDSGGNKVIEQFYRAQCLKDATMAESIIRFMKKHPDYKMLHVNGGFHSDYHLGIVYQLKKMAPDLKVVVISTVSSPDDKAGDYLIIDRRTSESDEKK